MAVYTNVTEVWESKPSVSMVYTGESCLVKAQNTFLQVYLLNQDATLSEMDREVCDCYTRLVSRVRQEKALNALVVFHYLTE